MGDDIGEVGCRGSLEPVDGAAAEQALGEEGRVLVRYSGTEPVARVMLEGTDENTITRLCGDICTVLEKELGL